MTDKYKGHAPGPWERGDPDGDLLKFDRCIFDSDEYYVCEVDLGRPDADANARLIADAPTLLAQRDEAVRLMRDLADSAEKLDQDCNWMINNARTLTPGAQHDIDPAMGSVRAFLATLEDDNG